LSDKLQRIQNLVFNQPWAIEEGYLQIIAEVVCSHLEGKTPEAAANLQNQSKSSEVKIENGVAVVPIFGVMMRRASMFDAMSGAQSDARIKNNFGAAMASDAKTVICHFDSPGGDAIGSEEMGDMIFDAAQNSDKTIISYTDRMMCSRAYWMASQANEVVASPDAIVGSIGVIARIMDTSRLEKNTGLDSVVLRSGPNKAPGNGPITDAQLEPLRELLAEYFDSFVGAVQRGRNMTLTPDVKSGRTYSGAAALRSGLVDKTMTLDALIATYATK
jgi:signal peptide peptidase SppA